MYPDQDTDWTGVFPNGTPFIRSQNRKPHYVFVWKTWGKLQLHRLCDRPNELAGLPTLTEGHRDQPNTHSTLIRRCSHSYKSAKIYFLDFRGKAGDQQELFFPGCRSASVNSSHS